MSAIFQSLLTGIDLVTAFKQRVTADSGSFEGEACLRAELNELGQFYNKFRIIYTPDGYKANKIYAFKPINGDADLATVRASIATRRVGTHISDVATGVPRLNTRYGYTCPRQLIESTARANLVIRSEEIDNAAWTKTNCTVTPDAILGPDGSTVADAVLETVTVGQHRISQAFSKSLVAQAYSLTFWIKPNGRDWIYVSLRNGSNTINRWYNITTGVRGTTSTTGGNPFSHVNASILEADNGWWKVEMNGFSNNENAITAMIATATDNGVTTDFAGDITKGFYIWGIQLEQANTGSSYIPTTTAGVPRAAETITTKTGLSSYVGSAGTIYFKGFVNFDNTDRRIIINDGTSNERVILIFGTDNKARVVIVDGGVNVVDMTAPDVFRSDSELRVVIAYATNDVRLYVNGILVGTDTSATMPSGLSGLDFTGSSQNFSGSWRMLAISNTAFTDSECVALSTPVEYPPVLKIIIPFTLSGDPDYYAFGNGLDLSAFFPDYSIYIAKRGGNHVTTGGIWFGMLYNAKFNLWTSPFEVINGGSTYYSGVSAGLVGNQIFIQGSRYTVSGGIDTFQDMVWVTSVDLTTLSSAEDLKLSSSWNGATVLPATTYPRYESYGKLLPSTTNANTYYVPWFEHNGTLHSLHVRKIVRNGVDNFTITNQTIIAATTEIYYEQCILHCGGSNWLSFASRAAGSRKIRLFSSTDDTATWSDVGDTNLGVGTQRCIIDAIFYNNLVHVFYQDRSDGFIYESKNNTYAQCLTLALNTPEKYDYNGFGDSTNGLGYNSIWEIRSDVFMKTWCKESDANQAHVYGTLSAI